MNFIVGVSIIIILTNSHDNINSIIHDNTPWLIIIPIDEVHNKCNNNEGNNISLKLNINSNNRLIMILIYISILLILIIVSTTKLLYIKIVVLSVLWVSFSQIKLLIISIRSSLYNTSFQLDYLAIMVPNNKIARDVTIALMTGPYIGHGTPRMPSKEVLYWEI